jgi:hypothetical protein
MDIHTNTHTHTHTHTGKAMLDVLVNRFGNLSPGSGEAVGAGEGGGEEGEDVNGTSSGVSGKSGGQDKKNRPEALNGN